MTVVTPLDGVRAAWLAWIIGWLAAAPWTAKTVSRQPRSSRFLHVVLMASGAVLVFSPAAHWGALGLALYREPPALGWLALALVLLGLSYTGWARAHLGRLWSGSVTLKAGHSIVRSGPYAVTRHPIYSGLLVALLGTAVAQDSLGAAIGLAVLVVALALKIKSEERLMIQHFGAAYEAYRREVAALVPGIW